MKLTGRNILTDFQQEHADARSHIETWVADAEEAKWRTPHDLRAEYPKVSLPGSQQAIFDICGNKYRLWVQIDYRNEIVLVRKIGTHKEYEKWDIK